MSLKYMTLQVLIIDDVSMVGVRTINIVNCRLQEIKANDALFGGINVLLVGDLFQLQPVTDRWIFQNRKSAFDALASH